MLNPTVAVLQPQSLRSGSDGVVVLAKRSCGNDSPASKDSPVAVGIIESDKSPSRLFRDAVNGDAHRLKVRDVLVEAVDL